MGRSLRCFFRWEFFSLRNRPQRAPGSAYFPRNAKHLGTIGLCLLFLAGRASLAAVNPSPLDVGYRQMYNLDFAGAHITFESWKHAHPEDPVGPVSNAAAFLFSEFERLHILETELFTDNSRFLNREKPVPDPVAKNAFEAEIARTRNLADLVLAHSPQEQNAQFADILADGLRGDYIALIEQRNFAGLSFMKAGRSRAEKLLSQDPAYYDAYLAIGVENYLLGVNSAPVRWLLRLGGAKTDKDAGINDLRITATRGHYLAPFARMLLAVAALRDKDNNAARNLLEGLAQEFSQNTLYRKELARIQYPKASASPGVCGLRVYEASTCSNFQIDFVTYPQNKSAGILHAPLHIRKHQLSFEISGASADLQLYDQCNWMIAAMNAKGPVDLKLRTALR